MAENDDITKELLSATDSEKTKQILNIFNMNIAKKNAIRLEKVNDLLDSLMEQVQERLEKHPHEFSNKDLVDYINTLYAAAEKSGKVVNGADAIPTITINQQNVVVNNDTSQLSRESRLRILEAVNALIKSSEVDIVDEQENKEENK